MSKVRGRSTLQKLKHPPLGTLLQVLNQKRNSEKPNNNGSDLSKFPHLRNYVAGMKTVPSGSFLYGRSTALLQSGTRLPMSKFMMGETPVTFAMWREYHFAAEVEPRKLRMPSFGPLKLDQPVVNLTWHMAMSYCEWASKVSGLPLTLPTEYMFEYAARGGMDGYDYPWGVRFDTSKVWCSYENLGDRRMPGSVVRNEYIFYNGYGLADMCGNVAQWCNDDYLTPDDTRRLYRGEAPTSGFKNIRGESWETPCLDFIDGRDVLDGLNCFVNAKRGWHRHDNFHEGIGFRLVMS